jgi:hypothetical protein
MFARSPKCSLILAGVAAVVAVAAHRCGAGEPINYQGTADGARWGWSAEMASPFYCTSQAGDTYDVHLLNDHGKRHEWLIRIIRDGKRVYEWTGHEHSVFRILDDRLYYARFHPSGSGGTIVAVDLESGKTLWESRLRALGPIRHSAYLNTMSLDANRDIVSVYGNESMGRYFEIKDAKTGETVGHRLFKDKHAPPQ